MRKSQHSKRYAQLLIALRKAREDAGLTQLEVADKLGVYASYVSKCESGERRVDVVELAQFCQTYRVELTSLLRVAGIV